MLLGAGFSESPFSSFIFCCGSRYSAAVVNLARALLYRRRVFWVRVRGPSEVRARGPSEVRARGPSEVRVRGPSEHSPLAATG